MLKSVTEISNLSPKYFVFDNRQQHQYNLGESVRLQGLSRGILQWP